MPVCLFAATPTPVRILDARGRTLHVNPAWRRIWGEPPAEGFPEGRAAQAAFRRAVRGGIVVSPVHFRAPGARDRWLRTLAFPVEEGVALVHQDVTALVHSRRELRRGRERWRRLLDLLPDIVAVHEGGRWTYLNRAAVRIFGAESPKELLGRPVLEFVHPDERARVAERVEGGRRRRAPQPLTLERLVRLDGSAFWAEVAAAPWPDGAPDAVIVVARDVTARVEAERENARLRAAIEASDEPIVLLDADCRVVFANEAAAALYGMPRGELPGRHIAVLRGGRPDDPLYREIYGTVSRGGSWRGEVVIRRPDGETRLVARRVTPMMDGRGRLAHQILIDRDITEERRQQEKLEHMQRLESLGVLAGGIAHDFNNLLAAILGQAALARREAAPGSRLAERLEAIIEGSERGAELCRQLLAYAGQTPRARRPVDLNEIVRGMQRLFDVSIPKRVVLRLELADNLPPVLADPAQMHQIVMNLVMNAAEAIGDASGAVTVATGMMQADERYLRAAFVPAEEDVRPGRFVCLEISDTGRGMDEATMRRIFEPFFTTKFTGRGLGMSAVLGIVRTHGGAIKVYSEPGRGTTFKVLLPPAPREAEAPDAPAEIPAGDVRGEGIVLVVDDEESVREVARMILEEHGWQTLGAADGEEAVRLLAEHRDEVVGVLLDLTMPRMDGVHAFSELRRIRPDLPILVTSGYNEQAATTRLSGRSAAGFLQKPYRPEELVRMAARHFGGRRGDA